MPDLFGCHKLPLPAKSCEPNHCDVCSVCCKDYLNHFQDACDECFVEECGSGWVQPPHERRLSGTGEDIPLIQYHCDDGYYNEMASLWLVGEEGAIKKLYDRTQAQRDAFTISTLLAFIAVYICLSGLTGGLAIPFGTFVPNLFLGAASGRVFALVIEDKIGLEGLSQPGTYALIGAASMLGGYTRMTMTVVVM